MFFIRQGATHKVVVGPAVAVGDGFTPVTGLTLSGADEAEAILHDNGTVVDISGYTWAAITTADGYYHLTLQSGISNTVGHMTVVVNDDSLILPLRADFTVLEEAVYDAMFAASALGYVANAPVNVAQFGGSNGTFASGRPEVNTTHWAGTAVGSTEVRANLINIAGSAVNTSSAQLGVNLVNAAGTAWGSSAITAASLATDAVQEIRDAITGGAYAFSTDANGRVRIVDGTGAGELNTSSGSVDVVTIEGSDATDQINAACDATIETYGLDHLLAASVAGADVTDNSIFAKLVSKSATADWDSFTNTTDALEALRDRGDAAWPTATGFSTHSAADVWAVGTRSLTILDEDSTTLDLDATIRAAVGLASANLDTQIGTLATAANLATVAGYLDTEIAAILADTNELQTDWANGGRLDLLIDAILDDTGTAGVVVNAAGLATDAVNEIRNAITGGAYPLDTDANGAIRIVDGTGARELDTSSGTVTAGTVSDKTGYSLSGTQTFNVTGNITGNLSGSVGSVTGNVGGNVTGSIGSLATQAKADVNAEVVDCLATDTYAEPGQGNPAATASLSTKLSFLYKSFRNKKTQTSSGLNLFNDAGDTVDQKSTHSDDGSTLTVGEFATGP